MQHEFPSLQCSGTMTAFPLSWSRFQSGKCWGWKVSSVSIHIYVSYNSDRYCPSYIIGYERFRLPRTTSESACINILIYIQQDATLHCLFYLETALHVSGCTTTHHQECKQLYLKHLVFVISFLLPAAIEAESLIFLFL